MADVYSILVPELRDDPLARGYAGMTDAERLASLAAPTRSRRADATPGSYSEWLTASGVRFKMAAALRDPNVPDAVKDRIEVALGIERNPHLRSVGWQLGDGLAAYLVAAGVASAGDAASFAAATTVPQSRAQELGLSNLGLGHMASAREMIGG